jgi:hypothetical protein
MIIAFYGARGRCKLEANISQRFKTFIIYVVLQQGQLYDYCILWCKRPLQT